MNVQWVIVLKGSQEERNDWQLAGPKDLLRVLSSSANAATYGTDDFPHLQALPASCVAVFDALPETNNKPGVRNKLVAALKGDARFFVHFGGHELGQLTYESIAELFAAQFVSDRALQANPFTGEAHSENYAWCRDIYEVRDLLKHATVDADAAGHILQTAWDKAALYYSQQAKLDLLRAAYPLWLDVRNLSPSDSEPLAEFALKMGTYSAAEVERLMRDLDPAVRGARARNAALRQGQQGAVTPVDGQVTVGIFMERFTELSTALSRSVDPRQVPGGTMP